MKQHSNYIKVLFFVFVLIIRTPTLHAQFPAPPAPITITANWTLEQNQAFSSYGSSVASAGDINGDGYADIIVGIPNYDQGESNEGVALLYLGSAVGINASVAWSGQSNQIDAAYGCSVASAGDVNNDGYDDVIVGARGYDNVESNEGRAYLYLGSPAGLNSTPVWTAEVNAIHAYFGASVACAGDMNNDGFDDIIIGASSISHGGIGYSGAVYIYYGNPTGVSLIPDLEYSTEESDSHFGGTVSTAGDVNGDGSDDVLVGAASEGWDGNGCAYVILGGAPDEVYPTHWSDCGSYDAEFFGSGVTSGDFNADGFSDIAVGATNWGLDYGGRVAIYYGSSTGLTVPSISPDWMVDNQNGDFGISLGSGDFNNDGYDDIIAGASSFSNPQSGEGAFFVYTGGPSGMPGTTTWAAQSNQVSAYLGSSVASAGDINGDGFDDMVAGAPYFDNGQTDEGQVRIYLGAAGCVVPPDVTLDFTEALCVEDGIITLTAGSPAGGTYTGTGIIGINQFDPQIAGDGSHTITYTYVDPGGCSANATDNITVNANPVVSISLGSASTNLCESNPVIFVANNIPGITYQWFRNGSPLTGETYLALAAFTSGNYQVQTTNAEGCSKMSKKKKVTHSGCRMEGEIAEELFPTAIGIYPNPNNGEFNFQFQSSELINGDVDIFIADMSGRLINQSAFQSINGMVIGNINTNLPTGIYILKIVQSGINQAGSFIVN
jgi:hypothetical protein